MSDTPDFETYAQISAELARGEGDAGEVLARHGLSEAHWVALSERCEAALDAVDEDTDASALEQFSAAFARAQSALSGGPASFEEWLGVLAGLHRGETLAVALEKAKLPFDRYLTTQAHWAGRVAKEPELLARFQAVLTAPRRG